VSVDLIDSIEFVYV